MRQMYDSTNLDDIPGLPQVVGYYVDGAYAARPDQLARKFGCVLVPIAVGVAPAHARVIDVERGDYLPWEAPAAIQFLRSEGIDPTVYVSYDAWAATQTEFRLRGIAEPHWWIALWDGVPELLPGAVAKQYAGQALSGGHFDLSVCADWWPGVDVVHPPDGGGTLDGDLNQQEHDALMLVAREIGAPPTPGGVADILLGRTGAIIGQGLPAIADVQAKVAALLKQHDEPTLVFKIEGAGPVPITVAQHWSDTLAFAEGYIAANPGAKVTITVEIDAPAAPAPPSG